MSHRSQDTIGSYCRVFKSAMVADRLKPIFSVRSQSHVSNSKVLGTPRRNEHIAALA